MNFNLKKNKTKQNIYELKYRMNSNKMIGGAGAIIKSNNKLRAHNEGIKPDIDLLLKIYQFILDNKIQEEVDYYDVYHENENKLMEFLRQKKLGTNKFVKEDIIEDDIIKFAKIYYDINLWDKYLNSPIKNNDNFYEKMERHLRIAKKEGFNVEEEIYNKLNYIKTLILKLEQYLMIERKFTDFLKANLNSDVSIFFLNKMVNFAKKKFEIDLGIAYGEKKNLENPHPKSYIEYYNALKLFYSNDIQNMIEKIKSQKENLENIYLVDTENLIVGGGGDNLNPEFYTKLRQIAFNYTKKNSSELIIFINHFYYENTNTLIQINENFYVINSNCQSSCETDDFLLAMLFYTISREFANCYYMSHDNMNWFNYKGKKKAIFNNDSYNIILKDKDRKIMQDNIKKFMDTLSPLRPSVSPSKSFSQTSRERSSRSRSPPRYSNYSQSNNTRHTNRPYRPTNRPYRPTNGGTTRTRTNTGLYNRPTTGYTKRSYTVPHQSF
jgi:hypothetical protein